MNPSFMQSIRKYPRQVLSCKNHQHKLYMPLGPFHRAKFKKKSLWGNANFDTKLVLEKTLIWFHVSLGPFQNAKF